MNSLEIAVKMEAEAVSFYRSAAAEVKNETCRKIFLSIAEDEKHHFEMLKSILQGLDIRLNEVSSLGVTKTVFEEAKATLTERVAETENELGALEIAMEMEKKGKAFYAQALSEARTEKEKALFELLIAEEGQHFEIFSTTHLFLKHSGGSVVKGE